MDTIQTSASVEAAKAEAIDETRAPNGKATRGPQLRSLFATRSIRKALAGLAVSVAAFGATAGTAAAGTNGQQLAIEPNCDANWVFIQGHNQNWNGRNPNWAHQWLRVPAAFPDAFGCYGQDTYDWGWWWKGWVRIDAYWNYGRGYQGTRWVYVPTNQGWGNDWVYTQAP